MGNIVAKLGFKKCLQTGISDPEINKETECNLLVPVVHDDAKYICVAQFDFIAQCEEHLSFSRGDLLEILDDEAGKWWKGRCLKTGSVGFIPSNYIDKYNSLERYEWYFPNMKRTAAECLLLRKGRPGAFIVRESESNRGDFSLSLRDKDSIKHYRIFKLDNGGYAISKNKNKRKYFADLAALVQHHKNAANGLSLTLTHACPKLDKDYWETSKEQIVLLKELGKGHFAEVWEGRWNESIPVAVKILKSEKVSVETFLEEASMMKRLCHKRLVQLYAVCSEVEPYIVMELMSNGCLNKYLRSSKDAQRLTLQDLISIGEKVADGLAYLEENHIMHRDVAARNVLVGPGNQVKLADFGLSRFLPGSIYKSESENFELPIKWTAPEVILKKVFSSKADVWSFGILLSEIITRGKTPYPSMSPEQVVQSVCNGYVMPQPKSCPEKLYDIMLACWKIEPDARPKFERLKWQLREFFIPTESEYAEAASLSTLQFSTAE